VQKAQQQTIEQPTKYVYGIMRNVWIAYLREKYKSQIITIEDIEDFESYAEKQVAHYESATSHQRALDLLQDLPKRQQEVLRIRIIENKSVKETAEIMGRDSNYVKTMHHRALVTLRSRLQDPLRPEGGLV
jgi:RNA polymerase sigma-70 factor (ECF subfamily)